MESVFLSSIDYDLDIPQGFEIKTALIRGGRIWGILKSQLRKRILFFADLLVKPRPKVKIFDNIDSCLFIYVSNDGQFCLVRTADNFFNLSSNDFEPSKITLPPNTKVCAATFFKDDLHPQPFVFIANDKYEVGLASKSKFNILPMNINTDKSIKDLSIVKFKDGFYCFSIIYQDVIIPYILDQSFFEEKISSFSFCSQVGLINQVFTEHNYIGCLSQSPNSKDQLVLEYIIDTQRDHPRPDKLYSRQYAYTLPNGGTCGICFFGEFFLHFQPAGRVNIFINNIPDPIDGFVVQDANFFDFDTDEGELYAIYQRRISNIKFESSAKNNFKGIDSLRYWLFNRLLTRKDEKTAAKLICNMSSLSLNGIFNLVKQTTTLRFYVYKHLLKTLRKQRFTIKGQNSQPTITNQKVALAYATYDLYTRIEMAKKKPDLQKYTEFTKGLIKEGLLTMETVKRTLDEYGWDSPYIRLSEPVLVFDRLMERNEKEKALQILPQISSKDERYSNALLRVFPFSKETVVKIVSKLDSFDNSNFAPILMDNLSHQFVSSLLSKSCQMNPWLARLFAIVLAREKGLRRKDIEQLFKKFQYTDDGIIHFIIREMISLKKYTLLTYGLISIKQYVSASAFAARSENCFVLIDSIFPKDRYASNLRIPEIAGTVDLSGKNDYEMDNETKARCIYTLLRSVPPEKAGEIAHHLIHRLSYDSNNINTLSDRDSDDNGAVDSRKEMDSTILMLLNYLPYNSKIKDLTVPINEFTKQKRKEADVQEKKKNEALAGIVKVSTLLNDQPEGENTIILHSIEICEKCKKPFFSEPGIIYPCSHMLHVRCAKQLIMGIDGIESEIDLDMNDNEDQSNELHKNYQMPKKVRINPQTKSNSHISLGSDKEKKLIDYKSDCPLCGYLSVRLMNEPYRGNQIKTNAHVPGDKRDIDPFTTDIAQLTAIVNSGKKTSIFNI